MPISGRAKSTTLGVRPAHRAMENTIMPRVRFHKLAAFVVLVGFAAWMGTGKFSSVGSAATEDAAKPRRGRGAEGDGRAPSRWWRRRMSSMRGRSAFPARPKRTSAPRWRSASWASSRSCRSSRAITSTSGDLIMRLDAEDKKAAVDMAESAGHAAPGRGRCRRAAGQGRQRAEAAGRQARSALAAAKAQLETAQGRACRNARYTRRSTASSTACPSRTAAPSWRAARWRR